jgi:hypothetical protein
MKKFYEESGLVHFVNIIKYGTIYAFLTMLAAIVPICLIIITLCMLGVF